MWMRKVTFTNSSIQSDLRVKSAISQRKDTNMKITSTWTDFLGSVGPYLTANDPLAAMKQAGIELGGEVALAFGNGTARPVFGAGALAALTAAYGPPPLVNLHVGRMKPAAARPTDILGGFSAVAAADLAVLNQVMAELWRVKTIPQEFNQSLTSAVLTLDDLKAACTGVPADAALGNLQVTAPPVASSSIVSPLNLHFEISFNLPVESTGPASLLGVVHVEQPLQFKSDTVTLQPTEDGIQGLTAKLDISPTSALQLQSEAMRAPLESKFAAALRTVWRYVFSILQIPARVGVSNTFPNSEVTITQIGAACIHNGAKDYLVAGINIGPLQTVGAYGLVAAQIPAGSNNIHAVTNADFATEALASIIQSGDLASYFNRIIARHVPFGLAPPIVVNGGSVSFDNNLLNISVDCVLQGACAFGKDLEFTASVYGIPSIDGDTLSIKSSDVNMDLDDFDAVVCTILGSLMGPLSLTITEVMLAIIAAYNPTGKNLEFPTTDTSRPLPGSDQDFKIQLTGAALSPGSLTADAVAGLFPDITRAFVHLKLETGTPQQVPTPLSGATVELLELDSPAPAGDDVIIPAVGETERITGKFIIDDMKTYQPLPDQSLGSGITNESGYVRIVGPVRAAAGIFTDITTREDVVTGKETSKQTRTSLVQEYKPDFAINVTAANGTALAKRLLIALNNPDKHLGTLDQPFVVHLA
jgi:hypothetical protein